MSHDHNHDHEERELITLVDEQGNETLFEILLTIDGKEEFGKNYVLLVPVNAEEDENGEVEIQAYSFIENEDGTEGELQPIPEDSEDEWNMIEEVFNSFMEEEKRPGDVFSPASRNTRSGIAIKEIAEREPATRLDRSFLLGERNESN